MARRPRDTWATVLMAVGGLWLALGGACTAYVWQTDQTYGMWIYGVPLVALGLIPLIVGMSGRRRR